MSSHDAAMLNFPRHLGRYELLVPIGSGATATVYLARTRVVGAVHREVALKVVHPHMREELGSELLHEALIAATIRHPNVVTVIEADDQPQGVFLALDYVEGETLGYLARNSPEGRLPLAIATRVLSDMLDGLHAAHEHRDAHGVPTNLVHRDLSLRNVLVGVDGVARLTDFGIAKLRGRKSRTKTGFARGTVPYMSPEQALGSGLDRRSDVWAAGVVAWELYTGDRLFRDENEAKILLQIVGNGRIPLPSQMRAQLPAELDDAIGYALRRDPDDRCPDALELKQRIVAAMAPVGDVASHHDVGQLVAHIAGERLSKRRRAVESVLHARASEARATRESIELQDRPTTTTFVPAESPDTRSSALVSASLPLRSSHGKLALAAAVVVPPAIVALIAWWPFYSQSPGAAEAHDEAPQAVRPAEPLTSPEPAPAASPPASASSALAPPAASSTSTPPRAPRSVRPGPSRPGPSRPGPSRPGRGASPYEK
jgi:serine/threonine-protein kinase